MKRILFVGLILGAFAMGYLGCRAKGEIDPDGSTRVTSPR